MKSTRIINRKKFFLNIILPSLLTQGLFILLIFAVIIPYFNHNLIEAKKEMIKEIINSALCIADEFYDKADKGEITFDEAKSLTISSIESIRYGIDNKDYIWITDDTPNMIMHPYRKDLNGENVESFTDPNGMKMFTEMVKVVENDGEGFVNYMWQWMDDSTRIVPKISYVKKSSKWEWIFGTGVYIEDIRDSIATVVSTLLWTSLGIFSIISFLLVIIIQRNIKVEHQRKIAEDNLKHSNEKYKALVEASKDGTLMFIDNNCIYKNKIISDLLPHETLNKISNNLKEILPEDADDELLRINAFLNNNEDNLQIETQIKTKDNSIVNVLINFSKILFSGNQGLIVIIKDLSLEPDEPGANLIFSDIVQNVSSRLEIGIFRAVPGRKGRIVEANRTFLNFLGYNSINELSSIDLFSIFEDNLELRRFLSLINANGYIREFPCLIKRKEGIAIHILVSAAVIKSNDATTELIDGVITKLSNYREIQIEKEQLLSELISHNTIWDLPIGMIESKEIPKCSHTTNIKNALELMDFYSSGILHYKINDNNYFITKQDIIEYFNIGNINFDIIISNIKTSNSIILDNNSTVIDCINKMMNKKVEFIVTEINSIYKYIDIYNISSILNSNIKYLSNHIRNANSLGELHNIHKRLPAYILSLVNSDVNVSLITKTVTEVSDKITNSLIKTVISQIGVPPCDFAFIALGSEGRSEQGLSTDQDNAIIYRDIDYVENNDIADYFKKLADHVNRLLDEIGYQLCVGEIMANNPKWNQPLSTWKKYFKNWIELPEPQQIIDSSIFFDFRTIYGQSYLSDNLRTFVNSLIKNNPAFLTHVASTIINYKLPVNIFGKIQTNVKNENSDNFNLKNAIRLIVNIVRLYAMKYGIDETNTLLRLETLYTKKSISVSLYNEMNYCYKYLLKVQFRNQINSFQKGLEPGNYLDLLDLTPTEQNNLKNVLNSIASFQSKVKFDFGLNQ